MRIGRFIAREFLARQEYDRYRQLYHEEAVPLRKYQQVTQARDSAEYTPRPGVLAVHALKVKNIQGTHAERLGG